MPSRETRSGKRRNWPPTDLTPRSDWPGQWVSRDGVPCPASLPNCLQIVGGALLSDASSNWLNSDSCLGIGRPGAPTPVAIERCSVDQASVLG
jgi:hypothetical protein